MSLAAVEPIEQVILKLALDLFRKCVTAYATFVMNAKIGSAIFFTQPFLSPEVYRETLTLTQLRRSRSGRNSS